MYEYLPLLLLRLEIYYYLPCLLRKTLHVDKYNYDGYRCMTYLTFDHFGG
jgi:hypothetical protein